MRLKNTFLKAIVLLICFVFICSIAYADSSLFGGGILSAEDDNGSSNSSSGQEYLPWPGGPDAVYVSNDNMQYLPPSGGPGNGQICIDNPQFLPASGNMFIENQLLICTDGLYRMGETTGTANVYEIDSIVTPDLTTVTFDLAGTGYLENNYVTLLTEEGTIMDVGTYSLEGNFVYDPVEWDYYNLNDEGIKFDMASAFYYVNRTLSYFKDNFGLEPHYLEFATPELLSQDDMELLSGSLEGQSGNICINGDGEVFVSGEDQILIDEDGQQFLSDQTLESRLRVFLGVYSGHGSSSAWYDADNYAINIAIPADPRLESDWVPNNMRSWSVMAHETSHLIFNVYRQDNNYQRIDDTESASIDEAYAIFWPCTIVDNPIYCTTTNHPENGVPDLSTDVSCDDSGSWDNVLAALSSALWNLRQHPRIGKTNAEKIVWEAMAVTPQAGAVKENVPGACLIGKDSLDSDDYIYDEYIIETFKKHNIETSSLSFSESEPMLIEGEPTLDIIDLAVTEVSNDIPDTLSAQEQLDVTVIFKNNSNEDIYNPELVLHNPETNPNLDNPDLKTDYCWEIEEPVYSESVNIAPGQEMIFSFSIKAPTYGGTYMCDLAVMTDGEILNVLNKDIAIDGPEEDVTPPSTPVVYTPAAYQDRSNRYLYAYWQSTDSGSGIKEYVYKITEGSPNGRTIRGWISTAETPYVTAYASLRRGKTYFIAVKAIDNNENESAIGCSKGFKIR